MGKQRKPKTPPKNKKEKTEKREGNAFDKIFKENSEKSFLLLAEERLGLKFKSCRQLKHKLQTTLEREMDFFYEVITEDGYKFILHIEYETGENPEMIYRVLEYHAIAMRKYKLPIKHVVIYLGELPYRMQTRLNSDLVFDSFELIEINSLDPNILLSSQVPEIVLLTIAAKYPPEEIENILRSIQKKIVSLGKNIGEVSKYLNQLFILSRLRNVQDAAFKILQEMTTLGYDIKSDVLYKLGVKEEAEKVAEKVAEKELQEKYFFVRNALVKTKLDMATIADLAGVLVEFVEKVKKEIGVRK